MTLSDFKTKNTVKNVSLNNSCLQELLPESNISFFYNVTYIWVNSSFNSFKLKIKDNIEKAISFLKQKHEQLVTKNILLYSSEKREVLRGFLLLPEKIDASFIQRPDARHLDKKLCLHMSCINITSKFLFRFFRTNKIFYLFSIRLIYLGYFNTNSTVNYSHMLDTKGIPMEENFFDLQFMVLVLTSSYVISNSSVNKKQTKII